MARSYAAQHVTEDNKFDILLCNFNENERIIKARLFSRHTSRSKYSAYLHYKRRGVGIDAIIGHYCECKPGSRTVGCCSHVAAILWYFVLGMEGFEKPASSLSNYVYRCARDSDDDD